jgi:hypothetical protein
MGGFDGTQYEVAVKPGKFELSDACHSISGIVGTDSEGWLYDS